jgi:hypothetical protein
MRLQVIDHIRDHHELDLRFPKSTYLVMTVSQPGDPRFNEFQLSFRVQLQFRANLAPDLRSRVARKWSRNDCGQQNTWTKYSSPLLYPLRF